MSASLSLAILLVVFSLESTGFADPQKRPLTTQKDQGGQTVLLLKLAKSPQKQRREKRFAQELRLHLDEITVRELDSIGPKFGNQNLGKQIATVRPILEEENSLAAIWLVQDSPNLLLLHVVAVSTGRALVRMIETEVESGAETELAVTTRELLGTAYLFDIDKNQAETPIGRVVENVKSTVSPKTESVPKSPKVSFLINGGMAGGIVGHTGPSLIAGGEVGIERSIFVPGLSLRGGIGAYGGPLGSGKDLEASGFQITGMLCFLYLWKVGPISLGPVIGLHGGLSHLALQFGEGKKSEFTEWFFQITAELEVRLPITRSIDFVVLGGLGAAPKRDTFHKISDNSTVYASPFLSWSTNLGLIIHLN